MPSQLIPFLAVVALITVTPGPDTVLVVRNAVAQGWRGGTATALGCSTGLLLWGSASALGISAMFKMPMAIFAPFRVFGAVYLVVLGARMVWRANLAESASLEEKLNGPAPHRKLRLLFYQGLLTDLLNPKAFGFFTAVLPQFISRAEPGLATTSFYAAIAAIASAIGLTIYAVFADKAGRLLRRRPIRRGVDSVTGCVLIAIGARLAVQKS